jgi:hypothetical protein
MLAGSHSGEREEAAISKRSSLSNMPYEDAIIHPREETDANERLERAAGGRRIQPDFFRCSSRWVTGTKSLAIGYKINQ